LELHGRNLAVHEILLGGTFRVQIRIFTVFTSCRLSLHPLGYHLAIGFASKLRIYSVLNDDLMEEAEFPLKNVKEVIPSL
jgi:hypothetical protein